MPFLSFSQAFTSSLDTLSVAVTMAEPCTETYCLPLWLQAASKAYEGNTSLVWPCPGGICGFLCLFGSFWLVLLNLRCLAAVEEIHVFVSSFKQ